MSLNRIQYTFSRTESVSSTVQSMAASHMRRLLPLRAPVDMQRLTLLLIIAALTALSSAISPQPLLPATVQGLKTDQSWLPRTFSPATRESNRLSLRGGIDVEDLDLFKHVSTMQEAEEAVKKVKIWEHEVDQDLLAGDMFRLNHGWKVTPDQHDRLQASFEEASVQFHLTQQFLILQKERIRSLLPGGSNCSYADSWMTGQLWDRADDEFRWTRSAWLQAKRARTWEEMPAVWKKIMTQQWTELQEFLAMLSLPDAGVSSERYKEHVKAWSVLQSGYMNNVYRAMDEFAGGKLQEEVEREEVAAKKLMDARNAEPRVNTLFEWVQNKASQAVRKLSDAETEEDFMEQHSPVEVHLFGIPLFNTKDPVSERLWSFGSSQGETLTAWPLKCLSWVVKKAERLGVVPYPAPPPTVNGVHVMLNNTKYQRDYYGGNVDKLKFNALEHIHSYITQKLGMEYNASVWNSVREPHEGEAGEEGEEQQTKMPLMEIRSWAEMEAKMMRDLRELVLGPQTDAKQDQADDDDDGKELLAKLSPVDIEHPRRDIATVFRNGGGGELRMVALALNLTIPATQREWLDDPMADEGVMRELLIHPRVQKMLHDPDELEPPQLIPLD